MKMLAEYLEKAITFERMAVDEKDAKLKADLEKQAVAIGSPRCSERNNTSSICRRNQTESFLPEILRNLSRIRIRGWSQKMS